MEPALRVGPIETTALVPMAGVFQYVCNILLYVIAGVILGSEPKTFSKEAFSRNYFWVFMANGVQHIRTQIVFLA